MISHDFNRFHFSLKLQLDGILSLFEALQTWTSAQKRFSQHSSSVEPRRPLPCLGLYFVELQICSSHSCATQHICKLFPRRVASEDVTKTTLSHFKLNLTSL